jgi:CspA family cold shock protein
VATGSVARFDCRRGYGFIIPDDGGEDVFVHQNNIEMEGFRYLQPDEKVTYELEVGEKGLKAVQVRLSSPRDPRDNRARMDHGGDYGGDRGGDRRGGYRDRGDRADRGDRRPVRSSAPANNPQVDRLRRKLERLINLLVEKDVLAPGEIDGLDESLAPLSSTELAPGTDL